MKRLFTLILTILICVLCIKLTIQECFAKTVLHLNECGTVLDVFYDNDENIFVLCDLYNNFSIIHIDQNLRSEQKIIEINVDSSAYAFKDDTFYFFTPYIDTDNDEKIPCSIIDSYNSLTKYRSKRIINYTKPVTGVRSALDTDGNYYINENNKVTKYSADLLHIETVSENDKYFNISSSPDNQIIFCAGSSEVVIFSDGVKYRSNIITKDIFAGSNGYFADDSGNVYRFYDDSIMEIYSDFDSSNGVAVIDDWLFGRKEDYLTAVNMNSSEIIPLEEIDSEPFIVSVGERCFCVSSDNEDISIQIFTIDDLENYRTYDSDDSESDIQEFYHIDLQKNIISGISPGTTISAFKGHMQSGEFVIYDRNGYVKNSGSIGTGYTIEDISNGEKLQVVVYGDLRGEGSINSSDKKALANYLLKDTGLEGCYYQAADINGDSQVNLKDYVALDRYLKGEYKINQNR